MMSIAGQIASEVHVLVPQVLAVESLLAQGATIPFMARYRKEAHGNLDEVQIGKIQERLQYYQELEERKRVVLKSIDEQGKLTDDLKAKIAACLVKSRLEDLYQPFKPRRRTRAQIAREKGYEPLSDAIWSGAWRGGAADGWNDGAAPTEDDLSFARDILAERIADDADVRGAVRQAFAKDALLKSEVATPKPVEPTKFEQYYDFSEPLATIPSHRYLALRRGQAEKVLWLRLELDAAPLLERLEKNLDAKRTAGASAESRVQVRLALADAYKRLLAPSCEIDAMVEKKAEADRAAVEVFAENLRHVLLASPLGEKAVLAIDPGIRTGCKLAMLDATGKYLGKTVIFPQLKKEESAKAIALIVAKYHVEAIAVGNGTAGRETESFVRETLRRLKAQHPEIPTPLVVSVSEAGASVYSASEIAREEFPDLDLTVRGAISIGRRLQDPLAELVKVDPKAIGVGQYQHDVQQTLLSAKLDEVVVSCVNGVGVELNTASAPLLQRVSGLTKTLAQAIVAWRDANGKFASREDLKKVKGLGAQAFEQCAGFLRIRDAKNPLDASAVHPERYALVERMARDLSLSVADLVGHEKAVRQIDVRRYLSPEIGEMTLKDIVSELVKPGRDPRETFESVAFRDDVTKIEDVKVGMKLEGLVTNVTAFGAFVDIGVHQDGLIHVSELSDSYVSDASSVVKTGDRLSVTVIGVDVARKRISLSAKSKPVFAGASSSASGGGTPRPRREERTFRCNPFENL